MEPQKILYLITKATQGGAQLYVQELARAARARGLEVSVAYGTPGRLAEQLTSDGIRTIPIPRLGRDIRIIDELFVFFDLIRIFRKEKPRLVNVNSSKAGGLGALAARIAGIRTVIYTAHGWPHKEPRNIFARSLIWVVSWVTILLSTSVIVVSRDDSLRAPVLFSQKKLHVVRNGINQFPYFSREESRMLLATKSSNLDTKDRWILALGELHSNKGLDILMRSFHLIRNQYPDTRLVILGSGEQQAHLHSLAKELEISSRVHLLGFVSDARSFLAAGDIFAFPSRKEGLPFALLEAGMVGLPTIATQIGGIPEVVQHEKTGLLVPPENPDALADAMRTLLSDSECAKQYGTALKAHVEREFSKERMLEETFALYAR